MVSMLGTDASKDGQRPRHFLVLVMLKYEATILISLIKMSIYGVKYWKLLVPTMTLVGYGDDGANGLMVKQIRKFY